MLKPNDPSTAPLGLSLEDDSVQGGAEPRAPIPKYAPARFDKHNLNGREGESRCHYEVLSVLRSVSGRKYENVLRSAQA